MPFARAPREQLGTVPGNGWSRDRFADVPSPRLGSFGTASGFSLVEVICAVLILGVALTGLVEGVTTGLRSNKESELQTVASLFAAGQIETLRAEGDLRDGTTEGECGEGLELYRWQQTISPTDIDGLHDVTVTVESAKSGSSIYELRTLLFEAPEDSRTSGTNRQRDNRSQRRSNRTR